MTKNFGSKPSLQTLSTYLLSRVPGFAKNHTLGPLIIKGWYDNNTRLLALDFNVSVSYSGKPKQLAKNFTHVFEKLFNTIPSNKSAVGALVNTSGATNVTQLSNLLKYLFCLS